MERINILYVVDNLTFGGGERGFSQLSNALDKERYNIFIACSPGGELENRIKNIDVQIKFIDFRRQINSKIFIELMKIIKDENIHIVHSVGSRADFYARLAGKIAGAPIIISTLAMFAERFDTDPLRKALYIIFDRFSERFVDTFIVVSEALKHTLHTRHHIDKRKIVRIYNGVELDLYSPHVKYSESVRNEFAIEDTTPLVGTIGRCIYQKGFEYFLLATPIILRKYPDVKFILVGDGPLRAQLENMAQRLGIANSIIFTGFRNDIPRILAEMDIFVLSSVLEGLPRVVMEAMAVGKPIVATDIEGIREELDHGQEGIIVPSRNPPALAQGIMELLINRDKAKEMGLRARKKAERLFSLKETVKNIDSLYQRLISDKVKKQ